MSYEFFVGVAFLMWLGGMIWFFISINSQFERNLRKVSLRLSWLTLTPKLVDPEQPEPSVIAKVFKFLLIYGIGFVSVFLGPIYVAFFIGFFVYGRWKDAGAPASVKEVRWKLRNIDMSADQVEALLRDYQAGLVPQK